MCVDVLFACTCVVQALASNVQLAPTFREPKMDGTPLEPYTIVCGSF
jgi:hypothetical protein